MHFNKNNSRKRRTKPGARLKTDKNLIKKSKIATYKVNVHIVVLNLHSSYGHWWTQNW